VVLASFIGLIVIEEAFHVLNPVSAWLAELVGIENSWSTVRLSLLNGLLIYGVVAAVGVTLLVISHWRGSLAERRVVRNLAVLLFVAGFFGGPVSTIATFDYDVRLAFLEELGEALVFALVVGYVAGLVALSRRGFHVGRTWSRRRPLPP
jgi:fluoride ion exporter CrcB/FEX